MPAPTPTKLCSACEQVKKLTEFHKTASKCKECVGTYSKLWRRRNLKSLYGITPAEYDQMLAERGPKCSICGNPNDNPCVDHNHKTGKVRGLICGRCNTALGMLLDDPKACLRAAIYLKNAGEAGFGCTFNTLDSIASDISRRKRVRARL